MKPALVEYPNYKVWINSDNLLHREDGPALVYKNGTEHWYVNGVHHRDNGPASEYADGRREWWMNGERMPEVSRQSWWTTLAERARGLFRLR